MDRSKRDVMRVILVLLVVGAAVSLYLSYNHFSDKGSSCDISEAISCTRVNTSIYSVVFNVPVALIGLVWFILAILIALRLEKSHMEGAFIIWAVIGVLGIPYLVWAEIKLAAICPLCTVVHIILIAVLVLAIINYQKSAFTLEFYKSAAKIAYWIAAYLIIIALMSAYFQGNVKQEQSAELAGCLTERGAVMYGSYICSHCLDQKNMFGESFDIIKYIECHPQGPNPEVELCQEKKIKATPTWTIEINGTEKARHEGTLKLEDLKAWGNC